MIERELVFAFVIVIVQILLMVYLLESFVSEIECMFDVVGNASNWS